jgi:hypothetical protein
MFSVFLTHVRVHHTSDSTENKKHFTVELFLQTMVTGGFGFYYHQNMA